MKRRVLLIDLDPQGNATTGSRIDKYDLNQIGIIYFRRRFA